MVGRSCKRGGGPYHKVTVSKEEINGLLADKGFEKRLANPHLEAPYISIDGAFTQIFLKGKESYFFLASSHEISEQNPEFVADSGGTRLLRRGESRAEALSKATTEYKEYRSSWSWISRRLFDAVPSKETMNATTVTLHTGYFFIPPAR